MFSISIPYLSKKMPPAKWSMLLLVWSCLVCTPLFAQTRLGLHYTQEELNVWKQRAGIPNPNSHMYKSAGDVQTNSPGDWDRITANANTFSNNTGVTGGNIPCRQYDRYDTYYTGSGCVPREGQSGYASEQTPSDDGFYIRDAAFYHLVTAATPATATPYSLAVKDELLNHIANDTKLDFSNTTRWCIKDRTDAQGSPTNLQDVAPGFVIAEWLTRLLYSYDYIKATLTASDRQILDNWFFEAAKYMQINYQYDLNSRFVDSPNGTYTLQNGNETTQGTVLYFNGPSTRATARVYSNRRMAMLSFVGMTGVFLNDVTSVSTSTATAGQALSSLSASLRTDSKRFFTEFIRYSIYPTGYYVDFLRGIEDRSVEKGYGYATNGAIIAMVDAFARMGDPTLYDYMNSGGLTAAQVGNIPADATSDGSTLKGLKMHIKSMLDLRNQQTAVYATDYGILYNTTTANATPPASSVAYTAVPSGWTNNPASAASALTTAVRRASSSYPWTTSIGILYDTSATAALPADNVAYTATSAAGGWTTNPTNAKQKCFRTNLDTKWMREFTSTPTGTKLIIQKSDPNYKVDGVDAILGDYSVTDVMYSVANLYYRDTYILNSYTRTAAGAVAYPATPQNSGVHKPWTILGQYPGILFMFGKMESDPANPFLPPPAISMTAPNNNATFAT